MRNNPNLRIEKYRTAGPRNSSSGFFEIPRLGARLGVVLRVQISDGGGWDHVSVSLEHRCPRWEEMCFVKRLFFRDDEEVMQLHPKESNYVNRHPYCLHLWRPQSVEEMQRIKETWERSGEVYPYEVVSPGSIPMPPKEMVG